MNSSFTPGDQCCGAVIFWAAPEFRELEADSGQIGATPDPAPKADRHCNTAVPVLIPTLVEIAQTSFFYFRFISKSLFF